MATLAFDLYADLDQRQMLRDMGSFSVISATAFSAEIVLDDPSFTATVIGGGDLALDPGDGTLAGTVYGLRVSRDGEPVALYANSSGVELDGDPNLFWKTFRDAEPGTTVVLGGTLSTVDLFGTDQTNLMLLRGTLRGKGGDDVIVLAETEAQIFSSGFVALTENTARDRAIGGDGDDTIWLATDDAAGRGGAGNDTLTAIAGRAVLTGNEGADVFAVNNLARTDAALLGGDYLGDAQGIRAFIRDFTADDLLVFEPAPDAHDRDAPVTLADLFGAGTLEGLGRFTHDGLDIRIVDPGTGNTVLTRRGEAGGVEIDERVVIRFLTPDQIDRDQVAVDFALL